MLGQLNEVKVRLCSGIQQNGLIRKCWVDRLSGGRTPHPP